MAIFLICFLGINVATNATAWTNDKQQLKTNVLSSQTTSEDAEDIANKLWNKTIKIDPNVFVGKNLKTDKKEVDVALVKDGILTQNEAQYVSWGDLNINIAGWYWNKGSYTVTKDGATATGHVTIDADSGESPAMIAAKIAKATNIKFNYDYWNETAVQNYLPQLREILVNEKVLTKAESYVISRLVSPLTIDRRLGIIPLTLDLNDNNTDAHSSTHINVVDDGASAQEIASSINGYGLGLKTNTAGMYADANYVTTNFRDLLVENYGQTENDMSYVTLPNIKLANDNPNTKAQVLKDGQIFNATVDLECKNNPYIYYYSISKEYFQAYVNLSPGFIAELQSYFPSHNLHNDLGYFYQMLCDGYIKYLPAYNGPSYIPDADNLDDNIGSYGNYEDYNYQIIEWEAITEHAGNANFATSLVNNVSNSSDGYLSLMFEWHWTQPDPSENAIYDTVKYAFW